MVVRVKHDLCNGCGACVDVCPVSAVVLNIKAQVYTTRCINCRMCMSVCPTKAISNK